jgi:hypothetical protein
MQAGFPTAHTEDGIVHACELYEIRAPWRAVQWVESRRGFVVIWGRMSHFFIPARIFADDAAREAFIAAVKARIPQQKTAT